MALALLTTPAAFAPAPLATRAAAAPAAASVRMETVADLEDLAVKCNPVVKFWDPLGFASQGERSSYSEAATIGWLRHAEIKHGRVAMAAFVGFIVGENGKHFPWDLANGVSYESLSSLSAPAQWDAVPTAGKLQFLAFIGALELVGETGKPHYMSGGKPGVFPSLKESDTVPHFVPLDLWDPVGFTKKKTEEQKAKSLVAEINNGRLAMIGIMAFLSEARVPGSVPALEGLVKPYDGEVMAFFSSGDTSLPFVSDMLNYKLTSLNLF